MRPSMPPALRNWAMIAGAVVRAAATIVSGSRRSFTPCFSTRAVSAIAFMRSLSASAKAFSARQALATTALRSGESAFQALRPTMHSPVPLGSWMPGP